MCDGHGTLKLGEAALHHYHPRVIGEAIVLTFEAYARHADQQHTLSDDRLTATRAALTALRDAGLIDNARPLPAALARHRADPDPAPLLAATITQQPLPGIDRALAHADHYDYPADARPGVRGLPVLSRSGHPSSLARITDPADPHRNTATVHLERSRDASAARRLAGIAPEAAAKRRRRARARPSPQHPALFRDEDQQ